LSSNLSSVLQTGVETRKIWSFSITGLRTVDENSPSKHEKNFSIILPKILYLLILINPSILSGFSSTPNASLHATAVWKRKRKKKKIKKNGKNGF